MPSNASDFKDALNEVRQARANIAYHKAMNPLTKLESRKYTKKSLYFALCGDAVKIGVSSDPKSRIEQLQVGAPGKITILAYIPNAGDKENECHKSLDHLHIYGEWYRYTEEVEKLIRSLE